MMRERFCLCDIGVVFLHKLRCVFMIVSTDHLVVLVIVESLLYRSLRMLHFSYCFSWVSLSSSKITVELNLGFTNHIVFFVSIKGMGHTVQGTGTNFVYS